MPFFFLLVSLEVKRELIEGELNSRAKASLPLIAAIGGMVVPAAIYLAININQAIGIRGWAIPTATDIAFSLAILTLLRSSLPPTLKTFLTALAIIDDLGAIIIIAIFYTAQIQVVYFSLAILSLLLIFLLNRSGFINLGAYFLVGILLWFFIYKSGIHATIAGVLLGLFIPLKNSNRNYSPLKKLEHTLQPWVSYIILPLFAFANTGISLSEIKFATLFHPVTLGVFLGLFIGKQFGIFLACWTAVKLKIAQLPRAINWWHLYGVSVICGIGFTMSLFIGDLSFPDYQVNYHDYVKLGVLSGSILSGITGYLILRFCNRKQGNDTHKIIN
jgi:NhaA family Na+:H+ antiporter